MQIKHNVLNFKQLNIIIDDFNNTQLVKIMNRTRDSQQYTLKVTNLINYLICLTVILMLMISTILSH